MTNGKIMTAGTPIYKSQHVGDQEVSAVMTRKINFADWINIGKPPKDGLNLPSAELKDLTPELAKKCRDAGMLVREIAEKFSTDKKAITNRLYRWGIAKNAEPTDDPVADQEPAQQNYEFVRPTPEALEEFFTEESSPVVDDPIDEKVVEEILEHLQATVINDSGQRTEFFTGAVRDMHEGKGRYDLLPWEAIHQVALHCEQGAIKYGERNCEKGIPLHSLINSAMYHLSRYMMGMRDEPHLRSAAWNLLWLIEMELVKPEMQDIPSRVRP